MLVRSNLALSDRGAVLGDAVVATAILDRSLHHGHVTAIRGDGYRLLAMRCVGLVNRASATTPAQFD